MNLSAIKQDETSTKENPCGVDYQELRKHTWEGIYSVFFYCSLIIYYQKH